MAAGPSQGHRSIESRGASAFRLRTTLIGNPLDDKRTGDVKIARFFERLIGYERPEDRERSLRSMNLLSTTHYRARRSFEVDMYEDEGRHLFVELVDGSVLYLTGQYLFDYDSTVESTPKGQSSTFPTTDSAWLLIAKRATFLTLSRQVDRYPHWQSFRLLNRRSISTAEYQRTLTSSRPTTLTSYSRVEVECNRRVSNLFVATPLKQDPLYALLS